LNQPKQPKLWGFRVVNQYLLQNSFNRNHERNLICLQAHNQGSHSSIGVRSNLAQIMI